MELGSYFLFLQEQIKDIFGLCCLGVRNFGFTVFWLAGYLGVRIPGCTVPLASDSSAHLDLRLSVWMFSAGRMVLRFFLGSHGTLVAASAPFMMPLRDSDIPMNVPFTLRNKPPLNRKTSSSSVPSHRIQTDARCLFFVSARTNKRHHHQEATTGTDREEGGTLWLATASVMVNFEVTARRHGDRIVEVAHRPSTQD